MTDPARERFITGVYADHGRGADLDEAFEAAADEVRDLFGTSGVIPSVASSSASDVTVVEEEPTSAARALALGLRDLAPGSLEARATAADALFKRRRARAVVEDLAPVYAVGPLVLTPEVEEWAKGLVELEDGELIESVEVLRTRARFKPVATGSTGPKANTFVVRRVGHDEVLASGATASEAKREALALARAGAVAGVEAYSLEVTQSSRRADGSALVLVERTVVAQKTVVQVSLARVKDPAKVKTSGWLFLGRVADESPSVPPDISVAGSDGPEPTQA